jgi:hypothetical protein
MLYYPYYKSLNQKRIQIAEQLDPNEMVSFRELLIANSIQVDALVMLMIDKGFITKDEYFTKLKQVQMEYKIKDNT